MSSITPLPACRAVAKPDELGRLARWQSRLADYLEIAKPRISLMVLITVTCGFVVGMETSSISWTLFEAWLGIAVVAFGSSAINQWMERDTDLRMPRTATRPLPSGRLQPAEVLAFGLLAAVGGCVYLALTVNLLTSLFTGLTFVLYALVYTPLKRRTPLCTVVGAIPGALPPVLGWFAADGQFGMEPFALFGILFLWQFPHFFAIAWIYRDQYRQAGLKMLPAAAASPRVTGLMAVAYALCLVPISLLPGPLGMAGGVYSLVALLASLAYLGASVLFAWKETRTTARRLLWTSLIYLPVVLLALVWDHQRLLDRL